MFNEQDRFYEIANLADQVVEPGSPEWQAYLEAQLENGVVFNPTLNIYSAGRDLMRARNADWHEKYTLPSLYQFFQPSRVNHGSYWYDWTTEKEIAWRRFRSEEHTSELQSLMRISYAVFCLTKN